MPAASPSARTMISRIASHEKWANTPDRAAATASARRAFEDRFLRQARERFGDLPLADLQQRAESIRKAYFTRLARASAEARARKARGAVA